MEERIAKLERQCRWYRNLFALLLVGIVAGVGLGVKHQGTIYDVISARRFNVINEDGEIVGNFSGNRVGGLLELGLPGMRGISIDSQGILGGSITVWNGRGKQIALLYADEYGNGMVGAYNRKGKGRTLKPGP